MQRHDPRHLRLELRVLGERQRVVAVAFYVMDLATKWQTWSLYYSSLLMVDKSVTKIATGRIIKIKQDVTLCPVKVAINIHKMTINHILFHFDSLVRFIALSTSLRRLIN